MSYRYSYWALWGSLKEAHQPHRDKLLAPQWAGVLAVLSWAGSSCVLLLQGPRCATCFTPVHGCCLQCLFILLWYWPPFLLLPQQEAHRSHMWWVYVIYIWIFKGYFHYSCTCLLHMSYILDFIYITWWFRSSPFSFYIYMALATS